ncbi:MAG TPA: carboxynorspermidine decarboxylase [Elusimicrobia bacterium]|nr:MAG: carboxynorspermidine decarboxylase [Elusimicrobia bacterium RIFOXYA12_FULL_49_49]OGS15322.1 MAG: carboxynorspermidine decarboxylase [Elusimicrobia bacterium RIFOXYA2_FULL_47_53]OGS26452.1 MAG: carboxynorspermidine decarboxylase [Elusimicrobia bacterium RIFOXYB12_FULL_50_12]OGS30577.1 MAG: carboxynorspermidine decarboxylase [Elusimicrobia bacterium RIFOXYB2_FULL_46_23]HBU69091.1 carboxynorspermidine decarboxylase [Elusimicrobiota bacterium]
MRLTTPYYLIDERKLLSNLKKIRYVREHSGAKSVLALKCFSTWSVFPLMRRYMDGTTSSSLYEAKLGFEKFGKETHAYCVAFSENDIRETAKFSDKVIFNSVSQLKAFAKHCRGVKTGLRINPGISYSHFDLADPARKHSRLGVSDKKAVLKVIDKISGAMFHFNCENDDFPNFSKSLDYIASEYGEILRRLSWVSLGGGLYFTKEGYPLDKFCAKLKSFGAKFNLQVYLEPGESSITKGGELVTKVLDVVHNKVDIAIVDASTEAHMLDLLIYRTPAKMEGVENGKYKYTVAGRSCLAGDIFGTYKFKARLKPGSIVRIADAAGYSMVKKNWFNGLQMPAIVLRQLNGKIKVVREFTYKDFTGSLS